MLGWKRKLKPISRERELELRILHLLKRASAPIEFSNVCHGDAILKTFSPYRIASKLNTMITNGQVGYVLDVQSKRYYAAKERKNG